MSINLVTYANQTVTPTNDAIIYERAIDQNGIFYGCNVTVSSNNVNITGGYGIICGREFTIQSESIAVTLAPSGTLLGRLYVRLDLADADDPIKLLTATGNSLPALEQDADVNYVNGAWEMELATFDVGVSSLSNVAMTYETIIGSKASVSNAFSYSLNETNTWCTWVDGKYIYKKTLRWNSTSISNNVSINHNISGIDRVVKIEAHIDDNGYHIAIPSTANGSANDLGIRANSTVVQFVGNDSWGASATRYVYVTLYYTK